MVMQVVRGISKPYNALELQHQAFVQYSNVSKSSLKQRFLRNVQSFGHESTKVSRNVEVLIVSPFLLCILVTHKGCSRRGTFRTFGRRPISSI